MNRQFSIKRSFTYAFAVFVAVIVAHYYALAENCWIPVSAVIVMQTPIGLALRQGILRFLGMVVAVVLISVGVVGFQQGSLWIIMTGTLLVGEFCYLQTRKSIPESMLGLAFIIGIVFGMLILLPLKPLNFLSARLYDVALGAGIGLLVNLIILPARAEVEFRKTIIPVLNAYADYFAAILGLLLQKESTTVVAEQEKIKVEKQLQATAAFFPIWVYEPGLSIAFRQGHRHFLIMIERVGQILFSLHHIARHSFDPLLLQELEQPLIAYLYQAEKILIALTVVLNLGKLSTGVSDLSEEMIQLNGAFNNAVPLTLELIDMSEDYILCAALIADLNDMRMTLIRLGQALRSAAQVQ